MYHPIFTLTQRPAKKVLANTGICWGRGPSGAPHSPAQLKSVYETLKIKNKDPKAMQLERFAAYSKKNVEKKLSPLLFSDEKFQP